mmetsp:Transcript_16911/g.57232  ORF Transcript_16911/g.57232 Transcript_16911/m.57232 type:complete len:310 (-) Transcript_16911:1392-2321(-)
MTRARERDVDARGVAGKAQVAEFVGARRQQHDDVRLAALDGVDGRDEDVLGDLARDDRLLAVVKAEDGDAARVVAAVLLQRGDDLGTDAGLVVICERRAVPVLVELALRPVVDKGHGLPQRPLRDDRRGRHERVVVKSRGHDVADLRVHAVLLAQSRRRRRRRPRRRGEALEQRRHVAAPLGVAPLGEGRQLTLIADEDHGLRAVAASSHRVRLEHGASLVEDDELKGDVGALDGGFLVAVGLKGALEAERQRRRRRGRAADDARAAPEPRRRAGDGELVQLGAPLLHGPRLLERRLGRLALLQLAGVG